MAGFAVEASPVPGPGWAGSEPRSGAGPGCGGTGGFMRNGAGGTWGKCDLTEPSSFLLVTPRMCPLQEGTDIFLCVSERPGGLRVASLGAQVCRK